MNIVEPIKTIVFVICIVFFLFVRCDLESLQTKLGDTTHVDSYRKYDIDVHLRTYTHDTLEVVTTVITCTQLNDTYKCIIS